MEKVIIKLNKKIFQFILGNEYYISDTAWNSVKFRDDSAFVREIMMGLWTKEDLVHRCLDLKKAKPFKGDPPRTVATPEKIKVILSKLFYLL